MSAQVLFTCVPLGRDKNNVVTLDVLVSPQGLSGLSGWPDWLRNNSDHLSVTIDGVPSPIQLSLDLSAIVKGVWEQLFPSAATGIAAADSGAQPLMIGTSSVSMQSSHDTVHAFYDEVVLARKIDPSRLGPDQDFLETLHTEANNRHGLQGKARTGSDNLPNLVTARNKENADVELILGRLQAGSGTAPTGRPVLQGNARALAGVCHVIDKMQGRLVGAVNVQISSFPSAICVSEPFNLSFLPASDTWSVEVQTLPPGVALSTNTLTGTPADAGAFQPRITVTAPDKTTSTFRLNLPVSAGRLPDGHVTEPYTAQVTAVNEDLAKGPFNSWSVSDGALPDGLTLDAKTGLIKGTPTAPSGLKNSLPFSRKITFKGTNGAVAVRRTLMLTVREPQAAIVLPFAVVPPRDGAPASVYSVATIPAGPATVGKDKRSYTWWIASGTLPEGMTLNNTNGMISGNPTQVGTAKFRIVMKDSQPVPAVVERDFVLSAARAHGIFIDRIPPAVLGQAYSTLLVKGGSGAYLYGLSSGSLPVGLALDPHTGILSGTPTAVNVNTSFTVSANDCAGSSAGSVQVSLPVYPTDGSVVPLNIYWPLADSSGTTPLETAQLGYIYALQFVANAAGQNVWSVDQLPDGLSLDTSKGLLSGVPRTPGTSTFSIKAGIGNKSVTRQFKLRVEEHLVNHVNRISTDPSVKSAGQPVLNAQRRRVQTAANSFSQGIALLINMPALMRACGLVFRCTFVYTGTLAKQFNIAVVGPSAVSGIPIISVPTTCTATPSPNLLLSGFLPYSPMGTLTDDGWIKPKPSYTQGCLELDGEAQKQVGFGTRVGLRSQKTTGNAFHTADPAKTTVLDEDGVHSVLPPSPRTGGLQVRMKDRQATAAASVQQAQNDKASLPPSGTAPATLARTADTLMNGTAVDILVDNHWYPLTTRDELYSLPGSLEVNAPGQTLGVRMAATRRSDKGVSNSNPDAYDIDETLFNWRLGSLVVKPAETHTPVSSRTPMQGTPLSIPWSDKKKFDRKLKAPADTPSPLFGKQYKVSMRPAYMTGSVPAWNNNAASDAALATFKFLRYELMQGPETIPAYIAAAFAKDETRTLMMVGSKVDDKNQIHPHVKASYRVIVPSRVSAEVAARHGYSVAAGATVLPLHDGVLPNPINQFTDTVGKNNLYFPDPLCIGFFATLTDIDGNRLLPYVELDFGTSHWPEYTPHFIELDRAEKGEPLSIQKPVPADYDQGSFPFSLVNSQKIVCKVPPGLTVLLYLHPQLDPKVVNQHMFANKTSFGPKPTADQLAFTDLCRPTVLRLEHAVDRPVEAAAPTSTDWIPDAGGVNEFVRTPSNTMNLTVTAERFSTAKVEVLATWKDYVDDPTQPGPRWLPSTAHLAEFHINKHSTAPPPVQPVHLPFSDSRYRRIEISADAYSRYARCFNSHEDKLDPRKPQIYTPSTPRVQIDVMATSAPAKPDIAMQRPAFHWEITPPDEHSVVRRRTSGLTVVINRQWNTSGNYQKLAVFTAKDKAGNPVLLTADQSKDPDKYSSWGFMPDFELAGVAYFTQSPGGPTKCQCAPLPAQSADAAITLIPDDKAWDADDPLTVPDSPLKNRVIRIGDQTLALYSLQYNIRDQQWYTNIRFGAPPAYGTVVRLIVASYQHRAVEGCQLSPAVPCDFALLSAQRYITFARPGLFNRSVTIAIHGFSAPTGSPKRTIEVRIVDSEKGNFDWVEGPIISPDPGPYTSDILWQAKVHADLTGSTLLVREMETYDAAEASLPTAQYSRQVYSDVLMVE